MEETLALFLAIEGAELRMESACFEVGSKKMENAPREGLKKQPFI